MFMYKFLSIFMVLFFCACDTNRQSEPEEPKFFSLQTPASLLEAQGGVRLSELADSVWYVPLETNDRSLLGDIMTESSFRYSGGRFYIFDKLQESIFVFSADGKFLNKVGKKGQGDGEIFWFLDFTVSGEDVYVADYGNRLHHFRTDGTYLDKIALPKQVYRLISLNEGKLACFVTDNQFTDADDAYSWLIVDSKGDSVTCKKTPFIRKPGAENKNLNYFVQHDFSTEYPTAYKEAFNDSLYYFTPEGEIRSYGYVDLGVHKILPSKSFDEMIKQGHAMRFVRIFDIPGYLLGQCNCLCLKGPYWFVWNKATGDFFQLQDAEGGQNIINDLGGPNFRPFGCVYPGLLIGIAEAADCPEEFAGKYGVRMDDNPILVMLKCKS